MSGAELDNESQSWIKGTLLLRLCMAARGLATVEKLYARLVLTILGCLRRFPSSLQELGMTPAGSKTIEYRVSACSNRENTGKRSMR